VSRSRFVGVEVDVLPLALNGDSITVKRRLNHGETVTAQRLMFPRAEDGKRLPADPSLYQQELVLAYLVDWNLTDHGRPVPIRGLPREELVGALNALDDDDFLEIVRLVEAHVTAKQEERAQEKKPPAGESASSPTSTSPA
jgi:hypothetical protein